MAKKISQLEKLLSDDLLNEATQEAVDKVIEPIRQAFVPMNEKMDRIAAASEHCKSVYDAEHRLLEKVLETANTNNTANREAIDGLTSSIETMTQVKQEAPVLNLKDEDYKRFEAIVRNNRRPLMSIHLDKCNSWTDVVIVLLLCLIFVVIGFFFYPLTMMTPAESLAVKEYRNARRIGWEHPGEFYERVIRDYNKNPKTVRKKVKYHKTMADEADKRNRDLSKAYSDEFADLYPEGLTVIYSETEPLKDGGDVVYMYCQDKLNASRFSLFVHPAGGIYVSSCPEPITIKEITKEELRKNWTIRK